LRQVDQGNIIRASDLTGLVIITQLQPIAVQFSLPQQQIVRVNAASAKGVLTVDVFGNDGVTVVDQGKLTGIDNLVDPTTGTLKLKAEFPNANFQLWPGQFVNIRLKVETLANAIVVPTSAVQRGPVGTFSRQRRRHRYGKARGGDAAERNRCGDSERAIGFRPRGDHRLCQSVRWRQGLHRQGRSDAIGRSRAAQANAGPGCGRQGRSWQGRGRGTPRQEGRGRPKGSDRTGTGRGERQVRQRSEVAAMTEPSTV
jgi:multidrug efflux system membrane fusion protein